MLVHITKATKKITDIQFGIKTIKWSKMTWNFFEFLIELFQCSLSISVVLLKSLLFIHVQIQFHFLLRPTIRRSKNLNNKSIGNQEKRYNFSQDLCMIYKISPFELITFKNKLFNGGEQIILIIFAGTQNRRS